MVLNPKQMKIPNGVQEIISGADGVEGQDCGELIGVEKQQPASNIHPQQTKAFSRESSKEKLIPAPADEVTECHVPTLAAIRHAIRSRPVECQFECC